LINKKYIKLKIMQSQLNQKWSKSYKQVNSSLVEERKAINFNQEQLAELIWNGKNSLERHRMV